MAVLPPERGARRVLLFRDDGPRAEIGPCKPDGLQGFAHDGTDSVPFQIFLVCELKNGIFKVARRINGWLHALRRPIDQRVVPK